MYRKAIQKAYPPNIVSLSGHNAPTNPKLQARNKKTKDITTIYAMLIFAGIFFHLSKPTKHQRNQTNMTRHRNTRV